MTERLKSLSKFGIGNADAGFLYSSTVIEENLKGMKIVLYNAGSYSYYL